jgi:CheY-like chemotaxis protein
VNLDVAVPQVPCLVQADVDRLRQIFWNLLSNAVQFTPSNGRVSAFVTEEADDFTVTVADTGLGISASFLPHVFERFRQADGSTTREHGGLGLGLAIVKELTELHGGRVRASSAGIGQGATFVVSLPKLLGNAAFSDPAATRHQAGVTRLDGVNVVAIDDNQDALDVIVSALTTAGARAAAFTSASPALAVIASTPPDIVLCDIAMPEVDGFEILRRIRQVDAKTGSRTPVVAVTAYASSEEREKCLRAGFDDHVSKPYEATELIRRVAEAALRNVEN